MSELLSGSCSTIHFSADSRKHRTCACQGHPVWEVPSACLGPHWQPKATQFGRSLCQAPHCDGPWSFLSLTHKCTPLANVKHQE